MLGVGERSRALTSPHGAPWLLSQFRGQKFAKLFRAGEGGFSSVWAVRGPLNRAVALPDGSIPATRVTVTTAVRPPGRRSDPSCVW